MSSSAGLTSEEILHIDDSNNYGEASTSFNLFIRWEDSQVAIYFENDLESYKYKYNGG